MEQMESKELSITSSSGDQTSAGGRDITQPAGQVAAGGTPISTVQPGGQTSGLFRSSGQQGVSLTNQVLPGVTLSGTAVQKAPAAMPEGRDINPALFGVSALLFIAAVVLFWTTTASGKKNNIKP